MAKRVLLIAYHYPPIRVSSGIQRSLKFSQYLPDFGWQVSVLTAHLRAYESVGNDQLNEIPPHVSVRRAFAIDAARHLSIRGAYPEFLALPDRWASWWLGGVIAGLRLIRSEAPSVLWSTYPIATAHLIGLTLHRLTGIPWIADFRDPMTEQGYPPRPSRWRVYRWLERQTITHCSRAVFTTPGTKRLYSRRYSETPAARWTIIANGYDEENFARAEEQPKTARAKGAPRLLVHSGVLYPSERDPGPFFGALADLKQKGVISSANLRIVLRASGHDDYHRRYIQQYSLEDIVRLEPRIAYQTALREMLDADALLLFQAANCNDQIPAKLYEYLRAGRPIFAVTDLNGDTAVLLRNVGIHSIAQIDQRQHIVRQLEEFLGLLSTGHASVVDPAVVAINSRYARTKELAELLDEVKTARERRRSGSQMNTNG